LELTYYVDSFAIAPLFRIGCPMPADTPSSALLSLTDIDRAIHEPARLLLLAHLFGAESADFLYLLRQTGLTKGNLSAHLRKLEEAGYVSVEKTFVERLPLSVYRLTDAGRKGIRAYRKQMLDVLGAFDGRS
jgi:DNA-binding MarR family transcriptional regulator